MGRMTIAYKATMCHLLPCLLPSTNAVPLLCSATARPASTAAHDFNHEHEDAARVALSWLADRHRKGWRNAFEALLDLWRPLRLYRVTDVQVGAGMTLTDHYRVLDAAVLAASLASQPDVSGDARQGRQQSAAQRRPTVSCQFLWDALGISR